MIGYVLRDFHGSKKAQKSQQKSSKKLKKNKRSKAMQSFIKVPYFLQHGAVMKENGRKFNETEFPQSFTVVAHSATCVKVQKEIMPHTVNVLILVHY